MSDFVRIRLDSGAEVSAPAAYIEGIEDVTVLDEPATNSWGRPLPATRKDGRRKKPKTTVKKAAAKKAAARKRTASPVTNPSGGVAAESPEEGIA